MKDRRYEIARENIAKNIISFTDIFKLIPRTIVGKDALIDHRRMRIIVEDIGKCTFEECFMIADVLECYRYQLLSMAKNEYKSKMK